MRKELWPVMIMKVAQYTIVQCTKGGGETEEKEEKEEMKRRQKQDRVTVDSTIESLDKLYLFIENWQVTQEFATHTLQAKS